VLSYAIAAFESAKFAEGVQVQTMLDLDDENNFLSHLYITLFLLEVHYYCARSKHLYTSRSLQTPHSRMTSVRDKFMLGNRLTSYINFHCMHAHFNTMQSLTVPIQGFLNAIVYGWTRDDFVYLVSLKYKQSWKQLEGSMEEVLEDAEEFVSDSKQERIGQETLETDTETDDSEG